MTKLAFIRYGSKQEKVIAKSALMAIGNQINTAYSQAHTTHQSVSHSSVSHQDWEVSSSSSWHLQTVNAAAANAFIRPGVVAVWLLLLYPSALYRHIPKWAETGEGERERKHFRQRKDICWMTKICIDWQRENWWKKPRQGSSAKHKKCCLFQ